MGLKVHFCVFVFLLDFQPHWCQNNKKQDKASSWESNIAFIEITAFPVAIATLRRYTHANKLLEAFLCVIVFFCVRPSLQQVKRLKGDRRARSCSCFFGSGPAAGVCAELSWRR